MKKYDCKVALSVVELLGNGAECVFGVCVLQPYVQAIPAVLISTHVHECIKNIAQDKCIDSSLFASNLASALYFQNLTVFVCLLI